MTHLAEARPHWQLEHYGTTTEGRPLLGLIMSSEENMANLDALREANRRRFGKGGFRRPRGVGVPVVQRARQRGGCTEAAMATAEALATTHSHLLERLWWSWILASTQTGVTGTCISRRSTSPRPNADPYAWEHDEPWPGGRPNHYLFDMNRDLAWQTQRKPADRLYQAWMPQCTWTFTSKG